MSASQDKRRRGEEPVRNTRGAEAAERERESKKYRTKVIAICCVLVLALAFVLVFNSNLFYNKLPALTVNGTKYTAADFNFAYVNEYNQYYQNVVSMVGEQYASSIMPARGTPLSSQVFDNETGETWADYLKERATERLKTVTAITAEAEKEGFTLPDEEKARVDSEMELLSTYALINGFPDTKTYLEYMFDKGMTEKVYRENMERYALVSAYASYKNDFFTYTDDVLDTAYAEKAADYAYYRYETVMLYAHPEDDSQESLDKAMTELESEAKNILTAASSEDTFINAAMQASMAHPEDYSGDTVNSIYTTQGVNLSSVYKDWMTDDARQAGDAEAFRMGGTLEDTTNGYYLVMLLERDDNSYNAVNGFYLDVAGDMPSEDDFDSEDAYNKALESAKEAAAAKAEEIAAAWRAGTYATPEELAAAYPEDVTSSGSYDKVGVHDLTTVVSDWLFDESRQEKDASVVTTDDDGAHLVIFLGTDKLLSRVIAEENKRTEDFNAWADAVAEGYEAQKGFSMRFTGKMLAFEATSAS